MAAEVVVSRDGQRAVAVLWIGDRIGLQHNSATGRHVQVRLRPDAEETWLRVDFSHWLASSWSRQPQKLAPSFDEALPDLVLIGIGDFLDENALPSQPHGTKMAVNIPVDAGVVSNRPSAAEEDIVAYMAAKTYWSYKFRLDSACFDVADSVRLGIEVSDFRRIAVRHEGELWTSTDSNGMLCLKATGHLLKDFEAGRLRGLEFPFLHQVQSRLRRESHGATRAHFDRAVKALSSGHYDPTRAAHEAVMAVESVAQAVAKDDSLTLGEAIKRLRGSEIPRPLDKVFDALWGYCSEWDGIRHAGQRSPELDENTATFIVNLAAAAVLYLVGRQDA